MMIDLHCHLLPGIDDGARDLETSLEMARMAVADGITTIACTPHILPGVYDNDPDFIREKTRTLQVELARAGIPLTLVTGSDAHIRADFVDAVETNRILSLNNSRYVLLEPTQHVIPPRMANLLLDALARGIVPILTHPERLTWIGQHYPMIERVVRSGVLVQITAGSLTGGFGPGPRKHAEWMLCEGLVHLLATDAHGTRRRPPLLAEAVRIAERLIGAEEASHLVHTRPRAILENRVTMVAPRIKVDQRKQEILTKFLAQW